MKYLTVASAILLLGIAPMAQASFELALVCDNTGRKIDRYDPQTGIYLGSFGRNILSSPTDISVNQTTGIAYVADYGTSRVMEFNYSTGEFVGYIQSGAGAYFDTVLNDGTVLASTFGSTQTHRFNSSGTAIQIINTSAIYMEGHYQAADGTIWYLDGVDHVLYSGSIATTSITQRGTFTGTGTYSYINGIGNQFVIQSYTSGAASHVLRYYSTSGTTLTSTASVTYATPTDVSGGGTAFGHGGLVYAVGSGAGGTTLTTWLPGSSFTTSTPLSQTGSAAGIAVIVSPEPASLSALAIGLGLVLRRKRVG